MWILLSWKTYWFAKLKNIISTNDLTLFLKYCVVFDWAKEIYNYLIMVEKNICILPAFNAINQNRAYHQLAKNWQFCISFS